MRRWSLSLGSYGGTEVRLHFTFILLVAFFGWIAARQGGVGAAVEMVGFILAMFTCVLLHEFGHVLAARRYGIHTPDITLLPIGGLARLERMPREPMQELIIALAGPAVNVLIAAVLLFVRGFTLPQDMDHSLLAGGFLDRLMVWNIVMVFFNLIPAFPMDGGRVLRALLALAMDYGRATRIAATTGQVIAVFGALIALFIAGNPLLLIIALFIFMSAGQEAANVSDQEAIRGLLVRDAMITEFRSLPPDAPLRDAVSLLLSGSQHDFPVLNPEGGFEGLLSRTALIGALAEHGTTHPVSAVAESCSEPLGPLDTLADGLDRLRASPCPALPVLDPLSGRVIGLLTGENISEAILVRTALAK